VCLSVCLSVCCPAGYLRNHTRDLYQFVVHVAYVRGLVLCRLIDDRPHRLSPGRGDGSAQRGRSVMYDCLVVIVTVIVIPQVRRVQGHVTPLNIHK